MTSALVELRDVTVLRNSRAILDQISFSVQEGEHWVILGPNGAGKSTVMSILAGNTLPSRGQAVILGHVRGTIEVERLKNEMSYVSSHHGLEWPMTAQEVVLTAFTNTLELPMRWEPTAEQNKLALDQLREAGLEHVAPTTWRTLSQGELARVFIARATLKNPRLLLLDEPAAGLDVAAREQLLSTIDTLVSQNPALTSIMVTHHLEEIPATTTHALVMTHGHVAHAGPVSEILTAEKLSAAFGMKLEVEHSAGRWRASVIRP
jgi:iron complex transport system ATP-binding protein